MTEFVLAQESDAGLISRLGHKIFGETYKDILSEEQIEYMLEMMYSTFSILRQQHVNQMNLLMYFFPNLERLLFQFLLNYPSRVGIV